MQQSSPCALTVTRLRAILRPMRVVFVIILLAAFVLPSGCASVSPPIDISAEDLETLHIQATKGNARAQVNLGVRYAKGQGVPQDYVKARLWYEQAAAQGRAEAQFNLGQMYAEGQGVSQDYAKARQWYEQAAAQGRAEAQFNLGVLYYNGQGVPRDNVQSYMWWSLVAGRSMGNDQKLAAEYRDEVAQRMTPEQIAKAQRLSQQCQAQQFKDC